MKINQLCRGKYIIKALKARQETRLAEASNKDAAHTVKELQRLMTKCIHTGNKRN